MLCAVACASYLHQNTKARLTTHQHADCLGHVALLCLLLKQLALRR